MATKLGKLGVWAFIDSMTATEAVQFAQQLEQWGYSALWIPEAVGRDPFSTYLATMAQEQALRNRIQAHWDAGANHVCIQTFRDEIERGPDLALLELLAPQNTPL